MFGKLGFHHHVSVDLCGMHAGMPQELVCRVDVRSGGQGHSGESVPGSMKGVVFEKWLKDTYSTVLPKSRIGQAIEYAFTLLPRFSRYVNDGRISIDNNPVERAIRPLALGRKKWLFYGNDASAYRAVIVYSLIGTCKNAGIEPRVWMEDVLKQIPYYLRDGRDLAELLSRAWASRNQL